MKDFEGLRSAMIESLEESSYTVSAYLDPHAPPTHQPANYAEALAEYRRSLESSDALPDVRDRRRHRALQFLRAFLDKDLIGPLRKAAIEKESPLQRALWTTAADSFQLLHEQAPGLFEDIRALADDAESPAVQERVSRQLRQRDRDTATMLRLAKELKKG